MPTVKFNTALIVGAGSGLSAALARVLTTEGIKVALAARSTGDLDELAKEIGATTHSCDAGKRDSAARLLHEAAYRKSAGSPVAATEWDRLPETYRRANRRSADRRNEKRAHPRVALVPSPTERRRTERRERKKK